jgi:hypothetical protein
LRRFSKEPLFEIVIHPCLGNDFGAVSRANLFLIPLDQEIDGRRIDIALLKQDGLKRTNTQFGFRQMGMVVIVRHEMSLADPDNAGKTPGAVAIALSKSEPQAIAEGVAAARN